MELTRRLYLFSVDDVSLTLLRPTCTSKVERFIHLYLVIPLVRLVMELAILPSVKKYPSTTIIPCTHDSLSPKAESFSSILSYIIVASIQSQPGTQTSR